jgi:lysozyme
MAFSQISTVGLSLIQHFEGFSKTVYLCPAGIPTIGFGHALREGEDFAHGISLYEAQVLLQQDVWRAQRSVLRLCPVGLTQGQGDALVSFTYNLGAGALQRSTLRRKLLRGDMARAAEQFMVWVYAGGRKSKGLIARRRAEQLLFLS